MTHCPTPTKVGYYTLREATVAALEMLETYESPQRPYVCECDRFHLTTKPLEGSTGPLHAGQVRQLAYALGIV